MLNDPAGQAVEFRLSAPRAKLRGSVSLQR